MLDGSRSRPMRRVCLLQCGGEGEESLKRISCGIGERRYHRLEQVEEAG